MVFRVRKRVRLWPLPIYLNASKTGVSWSVKAGAWSWNSRARRHRVDLPGPFHWEQDRKPRGRKPQRVRPVAEKYEQQRRRELRDEPNPTLLPAANSCGVLASLCSVAALVFGAPVWVALAGVGFGAAAVGLTAKHVRRERAAGRRGLSFLPEPGTGAWGRADDPWLNRQPAQQPHSPNCRAKSAATCRCPGRQRRERWGKEAPR